MKCDELKAYKGDVTIPVYGTIADAQAYLKKDVDEAIDELKTEHHKERDEYISMVHSREQTIKELNAKLDEKESWVKMLGEGEAALSLELEKTKQKLENVQASMYADVVDANMDNRRLRRSLWRAIALFCARSCEYFNGIMSHCLMGQEDLYNRCEKKKNKYLNAMYKCRAKMEEYK